MGGSCLCNLWDFIPDQTRARQTRRHQRITFHHPHCIRGRKKRAQQCVGQRMTRPIPGILTQNRGPCQRQIPQSVQHLVTHGLIGMAQTARCEDSIAIYHDRIFSGAAQRQTCLLYTSDAADE